MFNELYTGILKPYSKEDLPFIPHVSIGYVGKEEFNIFNPRDELDKQKYSEAINKLKNIEINFWRKVNRLSLISLNDDLAEGNNIRNFFLNPILGGSGP